MSRPFQGMLSLALGAAWCMAPQTWAQTSNQPSTLAAAAAESAPVRAPQYVADYVVDTPAENAAEAKSLLPESVQADDSTTRDAQDGVEEREIIRERFPNGTVKIEREVTQDEAGNYVNHGAWKMWDERGNLLAQGQYDRDQRDGTWLRWYRHPSEAGLLSKVPYQQYVGPFISQGTFKHGQLNGEWTIFDGKSHKISQWHFVDGKRHGKSTWWYPNGRKMREATFIDGNLEGQLLEWNADAAPRMNDTFQAGRKLGTKLTHHSGGKKKSEGIYLFAKEVTQTPDDWWNCKLLITTPVGSDEKHGSWTSWHSNGQKQLEGTYEHNQQVGEFTWWHSNGQRSLAGSFVAGKQNGSWTWWYVNGQKQIQGEYANGSPTGRWTWWREDGKVAQGADLSHGEGVVIDAPRPLSPGAAPRVGRPIPMPQAPLTR